MTRRAGLDPQGFDLPGGSVGCLLLHGFTSSPPELRLLGEFLNQRGVTVTAPLLPGHGSEPEDLNHIPWQDWVAAAAAALQALRGRCEVTFVAGFSMGSLLALHLAARHPALAGIALYAPATKLAMRGLSLLVLLRYLKRQWPKAGDQHTDLSDPQALQYIWSYETFPLQGAYQFVKLQRVVRSELKRVHVPTIIFCSTRDAMLHPSAGKMTFARLGAPDKELVTLHNSGHTMLVDSEREMIFARTFGFFVAHAPGRF